MSQRSEIIRIFNELIAQAKKIQDLPVLPSNVTNTDLFEVSRAGTSYQGSGSQLPSGGGGGTVDSIVAGTNITVDDTDPANPIVSSTAASGLLPLNPQPGDYQLLATDADFTVGMDSASPQNLTIPLDATESIAVGSAFSILTVGAAPFTLVPESGAVTVNVPSGATLDSAGQGTFIYLLKTGTNEWYATGTDGSGGGGGSGTVTSVSFTGGIISVANPTTTPAFTVAGTSGGIPYFSSGTAWASSEALEQDAIVVGGGAGAAPATVTTGTGVLTALGVNVGADGAFVVKGGALGTPSDNTVFKVGGNTLGSDSILGISSGAFALNIQTNGVTHYSIAATGTHTFTQSIQAATNTFAAFTQAAHTSGVATGLVWTGGAHTGSTASTEHLDWDINNSATITKAAGAITLQRSILFRGRTFSAPSASLITNLVNIEVNPPAIAGSATATNIHSIRSTGGWITAQQTATSTQGFRLEQSANVATMSFQGSNIFRLTSVSTMTIGPTSTGVFNLTGARNINYTAAANTVVTAHTFASSDTVSTANTTFASFTNSWNTVPAGTNTLIKHIANFTESAAVASTYVNTLIDGTLVFGASPTGAYYGIRVNPTITSLNSITGHGIVVDSPLLHNGFGVSVPTAVLQARGANNTVAFLAEDDGGNAIASFGESGGNRVIGFFGATPVVQQTMGAATAGGTYTATEQAMIQAVYDAVRNIGIGT